MFSAKGRCVKDDCSNMDSTTGLFAKPTEDCWFERDVSSGGSGKREDAGGGGSAADEKMAVDETMAVVAWVESHAFWEAQTNDSKLPEAS